MRGEHRAPPWQQPRQPWRSAAPKEWWNRVPGSRTGPLQERAVLRSPVHRKIRHQRAADPTAAMPMVPQWPGDPAAASLTASLGWWTAHRPPPCHTSCSGSRWQRQWKSGHFAAWASQALWTAPRANRGLRPTAQPLASRQALVQFPPQASLALAPAPLTAISLLLAAAGRAGPPRRCARARAQDHRCVWRVPAALCPHMRRSTLKMRTSRTRAPRRVRRRVWPDRLPAFAGAARAGGPHSTVAMRTDSIRGGRRRQCWQR